VLVIQPVFVAAPAAHRSGRRARTRGAARLRLAHVGQQPAVLLAAGAGALGAHEPPAALGTGRTVGPDHGGRPEMATVGTLRPAPWSAGGAQHPTSALAPAGPLSPAPVAGQDRTLPTRSAQVGVTAVGAAGDHADLPAAAATARRPGQASATPRRAVTVPGGGGAVADPARPDYGVLAAKADPPAR